MPKEFIKIAIVDDAPYVREILKSIAKSQGWFVAVEAENGIEALHKVMKEEPSIVLMDIVMPQKNGIETAVSILKRKPKIKIIACSTVDQENVLLKAIESGCCSYITKPFKKEEVIKAVEEAAKLLEVA